MNEELKAQFSLNLRRYLEADGKTQADLARYMKVSTATASDWCNGKKVPRIDKVQTISAWLGIGAHDLIPQIGMYGEVSGMMVTDQEEQEVVIGYRNADDLDKALVRRTLGLDRKARGGLEEASSVS